MMILSLPQGRVPVSNYAEAVRLVEEVARDMGYHEFYAKPGTGNLEHCGAPVAHVSYNGRVWAGPSNKWTPEPREITVKR